ncbi:MAG TPA: TrbI/VirB10 family protein [Gammaproteobacteria bacterium]|nr:TrbI/VirB10 family protein [Gammaproteobacteria bacterium]
MAIKLPSFKFLSSTDAKSRVFIMLGVLVGVVVGVFFIVRYFGAGEGPAGASKVAAAPANLQSVPGGQLSPEYYRALMQANEQAASQAKMTGGTAVPTLVNIPNPSSTFQPQQNCTLLCPSPDDANVANDINELVKSGKLSQKDADGLLALAKANVSVDEYAAALNDLVKQGKLTPEQARQLLEKYKKQHQNALLSESARTMDALIKSGQLPLDVANQLLALQRSGATAAEYAEELNRLVAQGKISPQTAAELLAQYTQQKAAEATKAGIFALKQLARSGAITPEVANLLAGLQEKNVPVDQYAAQLQRLVAEGKITPSEAARLLAEYKKRRSEFGGAAGALEALIQQQTMECQNDLKKTGQQNSSNPKNLPESCKKLNALKDMAARLMQLQANNASPASYAEELKRAVQAGLLSPEEAAALMQYYKATAVPAAGVPTVTTSLPTTEDFARLQQAVRAQPAQPQVPANQAADFAAAAAAADRLTSQERQQRVQQIQAAMSSQAQALVAAWQPPKMEHKAGSPPTPEKSGAAGDGKGQAVGGGTSTSTTTTTTTEGGRPLIKTGTIYFGVLDTAVDSDYPDTPVMVTIVQGPFKGAKLLGRLSLAQGKDRISLSFNLMDMQDWPKTKTVSAFAIDPDTARTVMASSVDHHYLMRYGSLFASSFLQGYAQGVQNAGTSTTGIFGTSTQNPKLSFGNNVAVALGQVGTAFTNVVQQYVNTPTTVKIDSGVGLGILFMSDVT